jgi:hypothetical protein
MGRARSNNWTDDRLEAILAETGNWVVNGRRGRALCFAGSLGRALDLSVEYAAGGAEISSLSRLPSDNIVVFGDQIERLLKIKGGHEFMQIAETGPWMHMHTMRS